MDAATAMPAPGPPGQSSNSSDFVRKLYKMLEDPSYHSVVRWSDTGDSFIVLETDKFTKSILPKHFKHSNFASFVRQLNKYDFHKIRNNEEGAPNPYGEGAWEFKHPDFQKNEKDLLDNIKRKPPAPRKPATEDMAGVTAQADLLNNQIVAMQHQYQHLLDQFNELKHHHGLVFQEVLALRKIATTHETVMTTVMDFLNTLNPSLSRGVAAKVENPSPYGSVDNEMAGGTDDTMAPLHHAQRLLSDFSSETLSSSQLEQMKELYRRMNGTVTTPPPEVASASGSLQSGGAGPSTMPMPSVQGRPSDISDMIYPIGHIPANGIDPTLFNDGLHSIPYQIPTPENSRKKSSGFDPWVRAPSILLVEDDPTCRKIGAKFLQSFDCSTDTAFDGMEAVQKMTGGSRYDLVLMDIIMPQLDGVSAAHLIRAFDNTPIIAMTSNIRQDDVNLYFSHGMNDILPKPFTKESLLEMLQRHLKHLRVIKPGDSPMTVGSRAQDDSPSKHSPSENWQSPEAVGISPASQAVSDDFLSAIRPPATFAQTHEGIATSASPSGSIGSRGHRRVASDMLGGEVATNDPKRQRLYNQQQQQQHPSMGVPGIGVRGMVRQG